MLDSPVATPVPLPSPSANPITILNLANLNPDPNSNLTLPPTLFRLLYPALSINPGNSHAPIGGAVFYASPLDLMAAHNVTLDYSVFFPADFDWVKGGKLPGLYGGHKGCSGGNDAKTCWSTRLMWREGGKGEVYLVSLYSDVPSFCLHSFLPPLQFVLLTHVILRALPLP